MKNITTKMKLGVIALALLAIFTNVPVASATTITTHCGATTTTRINGYLEMNGNSSASVWFEWGPTTALGNSTTRETFTQDSNFSQPIYGLTPNKTYYYRAMGTSDAGSDQGEIRTFTVKCDTRDADDNDNDGKKPTVDLRADDTTIDYDDSTTLRWTSTNADTCTASGGTSGTNRWSGNRSRSGSFDTGELTRNVTYTLRCENDNGSASDSITVRVEDEDEDDNDRPTLTIWANPVSVVSGSSSIISWSSNDADTCRASGGGTSSWSGNRSRSGSFNTGALYGTTTFTMRCENENGSVTNYASVGVYSKPVVVKPPVYIPPKAPRPVGSSLILVTSSVDRNQPIVPALDNTNPCPGDEINYTVTYQNVGTASVTNLTLRVDLPYEVDYMYSTPSNPTRGGQTLIFNLGTLRANAQGTVSIRVHVRENARHGAPLNFPAVLSYVDNAGFPQSVSANVSANVCPSPIVVLDAEAERTGLSASVFGIGFLPENVFGWLLLIILILILILLLRHLFGPSPWKGERGVAPNYVQPYAQPYGHQPVQPAHNYGNPPSNLPGSTTFH